jgi:hypothetical protein
MSKNDVDQQHVPVFVSSTYVDLKSHREEVQRVLVGLEQIVKGMEYFGSRSDTPLSVCKEQISKCRLFVLILGFSYGSVDPDTGISFTELEYDHAISQGIEILAYIADDESIDLGIPPKYHDTDPDKIDKLRKFKERIAKGHTFGYFKSVVDLGKKVEHDVPKTLATLGNVEIKDVQVDLDKDITEKTLRDGALKFEDFWLRPVGLMGEVVPLRLRINGKWSGWKVKDELIGSLGLRI